MPFLAHAEDGSLHAILVFAYRIVDILSQIIIFVAVIVFFWGSIRIMFSGDDSEVKLKGVHYMINSVLVTLAVIFIWTLFTMLVRYFDIADFSFFLKYLVT
jgi:hypothetical protein